MEKTVSLVATRAVISAKAADDSGPRVDEQSPSSPDPPSRLQKEIAKKKRKKRKGMSLSF